MFVTHALDCYSHVVSVSLERTVYSAIGQRRQIVQKMFYYSFRRSLQNIVGKESSFLMTVDE